MADRKHLMNPTHSSTRSQRRLSRIKASEIRLKGHASRLGLQFVGALILLAAPIWAQTDRELFQEVPDTKLGGVQVAAADSGPTVVRSRYVTIDVALLTEPDEEALAAPRARGGSRRSKVNFNVFPGLDLEVESTRTETSADGTALLWHGHGSGAAEAEIVLSVVDGAVSGSISTASGEFFQIRSVDGDIHVIQQVEYWGSPPIDDGIPVAPPKGAAPMAAMNFPTAEAAAKSTIDVLVVYTPTARQKAGGEAAMRSRIALAVAEANQSYVNSGVQIDLRLVHAYETTYDQYTDINTALTRLQNTSDGFLDEAHAQRDQYGADMVSLWFNGPGASGGVVGLGYVMTSAGTWFAPYAFSVVELNFATGPAYAFAHELGHNQGAAHDRANGSKGAYPYSYGFQRGVSPKPFRTIMAYQCKTLNCPTINYWSNPAVSYQGYATGVASTQANSADNSLTLNNTREVMAKLRVAGQSAPTIVSVTPASGTGAAQSFSFKFNDANGAGDVSFAQVLIHNALAATNACYVHLDRAANMLYLATDDASVFRGRTLQKAGTIENTQCKVDFAKSSRTASGNNLTLTVYVTFKPAIAGARKVYLFAQDNGGMASGWQQKGGWTVPGTAAKQ